MHIYLVTHEKELTRRSNTGKLVQQFLQGDCDTVTWRRTQPDAQLLAAIDTGNIAILSPDAEEGRCISEFDSFVLLDSTWQEANKMFRRSDYLQALPKVSLQTEKPSEFVLRANQLEGGLSTVECVIELLQLRERNAEAEQLQQIFRQFIRACL